MNTQAWLSDRETSSLDASPSELCLAVVSIGEVMRRAVESTDTLFARGRTLLAIDMPEPQTRLVADPKRLAEAIGLTLRAAHALCTPGAQRLELSVRHHDSALFLRLRNAPRGALPVFVARAFDILLRHPRQPTVAAGTVAGLRLPPLARAVLRMHGGDSMVFCKDRQHPAAPGFEFVLRLPLAVRRPAARPALVH